MHMNGYYMVASQHKGQVLNLETSVANKVNVKTAEIPSSLY